jgi:cytoskeletal protein CcmA (bactofilin family)
LSTTDAVRRYYGKYRGVVLDNFDPMMLGRIMPEVPSVPGMLLNWALPCFPYGGPRVGFFAIPPIGATVWIEFEGGDPNYPIWSGCYWEDPLEVPVDPAIPFIKGMVTEFITMLWDDTPGEGGFTLRLTAPVSPSVTEIFCGVEGITITLPPVTISITPAEVTLEMPPTTITVTEALVSVDLPASFIEITEAGITVTADEVEVMANVTVIGPVEIEGNVNITGAVEIEGNVNITGAVEIEGNVNITGAMEIEGNVNIVGACEVEGDHNVLGACTVEGDHNVAGALTVEGDEAVLGVIEGVVVPPLL